MKNLKKPLALCLLGLLLAAAGCRDFLNEPENSGSNAAGTVVVSVGDGTGAARTLMPVELTGFTYELAFSNGPGGAVHNAETIIPGTPITISLAPGNWTITALEKSGETVLAQGVWTGEVRASGTTAVALTLSPVSDGLGRLSCLFTFPPAVTAKLLTLHKVSPGAPDEPVEGTPVTAISSGVPGRFDDLAAGFYRLSLRLEAGGKTASRTESVHIYAGLTTNAAWVFSAEDFQEAPPAPLSPPIVESGGIRTLNVSWAPVAGAQGYEVYYGTAADGTGRVPFPGVIPASASPAAVITGLQTDTPYYVWVRAKNERGTSGFSPSATGTPQRVPVEFNPTGDDSSGTVLQGLTGGGTASEGWTLNVSEQPAVYCGGEDLRSDH